MADWAVAVAHWNMQGTACDHLQRQGFEVYAPRFCEQTVRHGRKILRSRYLFDCYFFVAFVECWRAIVSTKGVSKLLMSGDRLSVVDQTIISELRNREDGRGFVRLKQNHHHRFRCGQSVRVIYGPMSGVIGIVAGMSGPERVRVLLNILGRKTPATMHQDQIAAA